MKIIWKQSYTEMPFSSFEHKIKNKLQDATVQPTTEVWEKLSSRLQVEGGDESKAVFILPLFLRNENLKYTLSSAAAVTLMAVALGTWYAADENPGQEVLANVKTVEIEQVPCTDPIEQKEDIYIYSVETTKPMAEVSKKKIQEQAKFELLAGHEVTVGKIDPTGLSLSSHLNEKALKTISPLSTGISGIEARPIIALSTNQEVPDRIVPAAKRQSHTFKPRLTWGLTAMSALQLNSLSESIQASEFEDNLVGISSLSSQFRYPNGLTSARAELEVLLTEKLGVGTGIGFSTSYQNSRFDNSGRGVNDLPGNMTSTTGNPANVDFLAQGSGSSMNDLDYTSIDIPLFLNYYLKKGKSNILVSTGILYKHMMEGEPNLLVETVAYTTNAQPSVRYVDPAQGNFSIKDLVFLIGRAHYQLNLGNSFALHAGPSLNMGLGPAFSYQQSSSKKPFSLGFEVGLKFFPGG